MILLIIALVVALASAELPVDLVGHIVDQVTDRETLFALTLASAATRHAVLLSDSWRFLTRIRAVFCLSPAPIDAESIREIADLVVIEPRYRSLLSSAVTPDRMLALFDRIQLLPHDKQDVAKEIIAHLGRCFDRCRLTEVISPDFVERFFYGLHDVEFAPGLTLIELVTDPHDLTPLQTAYGRDAVDHLMEMQSCLSPIQTPLYRFRQFPGLLGATLRQFQRPFFERLFIHNADPIRLADANVLRTLLRIGIRFRIRDVLIAIRDPGAIRVCWPYLEKLYLNPGLLPVTMRFLRHDRLTDWLKSLIFAWNDRVEFQIPHDIADLVGLGPDPFHEFMRVAILPNLVNDEFEPGGLTLLHCATQARASEIVAFLLQVPNIDRNRRDAQGWAAHDLTGSGS